MKILNGQEAFAALMAGKNIMCRAVGGLIEFDDLNQFPATVFAMPNYEFCVKIGEITINGYTFLKPYSLDELVEGQDVFLLGNTGSIIKGQFIPEYDELVLAVKNGSVQRDFESAQKQAKAIQSLLGIDNDLVLKVVDFQEFIKPATKSKKTTRKKTEPEAIQAESVKPIGTESTGEQWGEIETPAESTSIDVENKTSDDAKVWKTSAQETHELLAETREMAEAMMVDTTHGPVLNSFALEVEQEIAAEQAIKHQEHLSEILNDIALANTPAEVNAHIRYTRSWTEEQRKPVMTAINKRLVELTAINPIEVSQPPSLMVRIQSASTEHELNELLPEVRSRHPDIQPKLMDCVKKRRFELENQVVTL